MRPQKMIMAILLAFAPFVANADVIDFEDIDLANNSSRVDASYTSQGFLFAPVSNSLALLQNGGGCGPSCAANGTKTLSAGGVASSPSSIHPVNMSSTAGLSFILGGLDYAEFVRGGHPANATVLQLVGNLAGGGTVSQILRIDGINDGPGGGIDFQTAVLSSFWATSVLTSLDFFGFDGDRIRRGFQIDNIVVNPARVPEPGTLALFGIGLLGLGLARRKKA